VVVVGGGAGALHGGGDGADRAGGAGRQQHHGAGEVPDRRGDADYMARQCCFIRPAFQAALELGAEDAWQQIEAGIDGRLRSCARPLRRALPGCTEEEIRSLGRSLRRTFYSALIDRTVTRTSQGHRAGATPRGPPRYCRPQGGLEEVEELLRAEQARACRCGTTAWREDRRRHALGC
jgi:hypothetical protein